MLFSPSRPVAWLHAGAGAAYSSGEHDPSLREGQGRLVDQHSALQPGEDQEGSHGQWWWGLGGWLWMWR